jgi:monoamine oxidase
MSPRRSRDNSSVNQRRGVKTTVELPEAVWRAAKIRAVEDYTDLRTIVITALVAYLHVSASQAGQHG